MTPEALRQALIAALSNDANVPNASWEDADMLVIDVDPYYVVVEIDVDSTVYAFVTIDLDVADPWALDSDDGPLFASTRPDASVADALDAIHEALSLARRAIRRLTY